MIPKFNSFLYQDLASKFSGENRPALIRRQTRQIAKGLRGSIMRKKGPRKVKHKLNMRKNYKIIEVEP